MVEQLLTLFQNGEITEDISAMSKETRPSESEVLRRSEVIKSIKDYKTVHASPTQSINNIKNITYFQH